ncbi:reverse transcriptase domain-containing protein [Tanacetum coccineum]|uniref:Retrotransposon gag domain-containing protein n=1 Tax=Tanacetum coccineum TaxID=301880 RepID=A0ABQ5GZX2_9ASTR
METRGRKKSIAEPAPPVRNPRDVETIERLQQRIQELEPQQFRPDSPAEEVEAEPNIEILEFTGKVYPDDFIDWLSTVERVFDDHVNKRRRIKGKLKVRTWEKMKKLRKAKFLPENHHQEAFLDYHYLSQQNMTVEEVIIEFDKIRMRCDVVEEEEQTYTDVCRLALKVEKQIKEKSKGSNSRFTLPTRTAPPIAPKIAPKATTPQPRLQVILENVLIMALVLTSLIYDTDAEPELDEPCDELVYPVVERRWLLESLKYGGSCENVVSTYMVEKLGMKTEEHPKPYHYKDEVWCEVISMDAAHILLGRPWQFDGKTKHVRFQNTYSFKKDGVNITLVPFDSRQTQEEGSNLFMKKTDFERLMKTTPYVFTLVVVEENEIISEAPLQVQSLLREFADVIPDDIPVDYQL